MGFVLFVISIIFLTHVDTWKDYVSTLPVSWFKSILAVSTHQYASMVVGLIVVLLSALAVYRLIRIQKNKNVFRKLNLKGNEIEIFEESDDSYFDKYLNEVLYLFENADADAIVFEDMDRFNANRIFERLREVNTLANIQLQKENKKPLRFFYLLRDDIFVSKDRTKFFDYIIPVVPVVDSSNSYDQFITHLKKGGILGIFNEGFLQGLSLYIDDMRLLKNIYNEFTIYYNRINTTELNCNKMLAIITYKNLFPRDFADLQLNVSKLLGKETIDTNSYGQSKGRNGSYSTNWQLAGRELMTPDEVRMLDNRYALLFIRGERPVEDLKFDILKHPNIALTTDGGAEPYRHGEDSISIAALSIDENLLKKAGAEPVSEDEYLFFCEEELEELLQKKMEEKQHEQENQEQD